MNAQALLLAALVGGGVFLATRTPRRDFSITGPGGVTAQPGYAFDWFERNTWDGSPFGVGGGVGIGEDGAPEAPKATPGEFGVGSGYGSDLLNSDPFSGLK